MWPMEEEMFVPVRRTEHVEVTSRAVEVAPAAKWREAAGASSVAGPRTVRFFCDDYDATDSSGDEAEEDAVARRRVKRYVQEIRLERAVKEEVPAGRAATNFEQVDDAPVPLPDEVAERLTQPPTPALAPAASKNASSSATSYDSGEESHAAAASPTSVLRSFPPSAVADDTCSKAAAKKPAPAPETDESTGGSSSVFGYPFSSTDDCFGCEFPPLYTDFDLLADFPEPSLDFLADIPEEPLSLAPSIPVGSPEECPSDAEPASPAKWQQVDDFFQDITDLFQIDPHPVV